MPEPVLRPLRRHAFKLTRADYEALQKRFDDRPVSVSLIFALAVFAALGLGLAEPGWFGELALLPVIAVLAVVLYGLAHLWRRLRRRRRVARWTPPVDPVEMEEHADHLAVREDGRLRIFAFDTIADVSADSERVYIVKSRSDFVIAPLSAFGNREAMRAFVESCKRRMSALGAEEKGDPAEPPAFRARPAVPAGSDSGIARESVTVALTHRDAIAIEAALRKPAAPPVLTLSAGSAIAGVAGGLIAGGLVWALASALAPDVRLSAGALAAWAGAILLTFLGARRIEVARAAEWPADDPRRMTRRIEIDEAGLVSRGADFDTRIAWAGVESIRETEQHVLFVTRWKEIYAAPKRCFESADAARAFANKARSFKTAS